MELFTIGFLAGLLFGIIIVVIDYAKSCDKAALKRFRRSKLVNGLKYNCYQLYVSDVIPERIWQDLERRLNEISKDLEGD